MVDFPLHKRSVDTARSEYSSTVLVLAFYLFVSSNFAVMCRQYTAPFVKIMTPCFIKGYMIAGYVANFLFKILKLPPLWIKPLQLGPM